MGMCHSTWTWKSHFPSKPCVPGVRFHWSMLVCQARNSNIFKRQNQLQTGSNLPPPCTSPVWMVEFLDDLQNPQACSCRQRLLAELQVKPNTRCQGHVLVYRMYGPIRFRNQNYIYIYLYTYIYTYTPYIVYVIYIIRMYIYIYIYVCIYLIHSTYTQVHTLLCEYVDTYIYI